MTNDQQTVALATLRAAEDDILSFPEICGEMMAAGFERYIVDYARATRVCYLPNGEFVEHETHRTDSQIGGEFDAAAIREAIREAQENGPDYTYLGFCEKVVAAGCGGYMVSFLGRRAVYFGRSGETHVEYFPQ